MQRFMIGVDPYSAYYKVSIPNYNGGEVVDAESHDAEVARLNAILANRVECADCHALVPQSAVFPATASDEAESVCWGCGPGTALRERLRKAEDERARQTAFASANYNTWKALQERYVALYSAVAPIRQKLGAVEYLDDVDDDARSGRRPWPLEKSLTIGEVRAFVAAYDAGDVREEVEVKS